MNELRWMYELVRVESPHNMLETATLPGFGGGPRVVAWSCGDCLDYAQGHGWDYRDGDDDPDVNTRPCDFCERSGMEWDQ